MLSTLLWLQRKLLLSGTLFVNQKLLRALREPMPCAHDWDHQCTGVDTELYGSGHHRMTEMLLYGVRAELSLAWDHDGHFSLCVHTRARVCVFAWLS